MEDILVGKTGLRGDDAKPFRTPDSPVRNTLQKAYDDFPFLETAPMLDIETDGKPVSCPPRSYLQDSLGLYLQEINTSLPIFQENRLRAAVDRQYSENPSSISEAQNLCFNNIVILAQGIKRRATFLRSSYSNFDDDLFDIFLNNSRRALGSLHTFTKPSFVNIQALASLVSFSKPQVSLEYADWSRVLLQPSTLTPSFLKDSYAWQVTLFV